MFERRQFPDFSWSHGRQKKLQFCQRAYYWHYYGSHNGWLEDPSTAAGLAYRLKQLTTYQIEVGQAVHQAARQIARSIKERLPRPSIDQLREEARRTLNDLVRRDRMGADAFLCARRPKDQKITQAAYYGHQPTSEDFTNLKNRLEECLRRLCGHPAWDDIERTEPAHVLVVDELSWFELAAPYSVRVYAAPDLVFRTVTDDLVVLDWKTGSLDGERTQREVEEQLTIYGLFVEEELGVPLTDGATGCAISLLGGDDFSVPYDHLTRAHALAMIGEGVTRMKALLGDAGSNAPLPIDCFPMTPRMGACGSCNYRQLCDRA